jgi:hypothetical protein
MLVPGGLVTSFNEEMLRSLPRRQAESVVGAAFALSFPSWAETEPARFEQLDNP